MPETLWLDFSGAPPLIIPRSLVSHWRGPIYPSTGKWRLCNRDRPITDYDRACLAALPGRAILEFRGTRVLSLYTECDLHSWCPHREMAGSGGLWPSDAELRDASWSDPVHWRAEHGTYLMMNSAADGGRGLRDGDSLPIVLTRGDYVITTAQVCHNVFHRFTLTPDR